MPSFYIIILLIGVGVFGMLFQLFMTVSYKYLSVAMATPTMYSAVVFGGILDWLIGMINHLGIYHKYDYSLCRHFLCCIFFTGFKRRKDRKSTQKLIVHSMWKNFGI